MEIKNLTEDEGSNRIVGLIVGESGIGKTTLAGTLKGKTLIASAESGLICLKKFPLEIRKNIDFVEIKSIKDFHDFYELINKEENKEKYDNLFVDSLTEIGEVILADLKKDPKMTDNFKLYGRLAEIFSWFVKMLRDIKPYNVWITCLNSYEKNGVEMVEEFNFPGGKGKENLKGWLDLVLKYQVFKDDKGESHRKLISSVEVNRLAKDRSGMLNSYENADLSAITNKILGVSNGK